MYSNYKSGSWLYILFFKPVSEYTATFAFSPSESMLFNNQLLLQTQVKGDFGVCFYELCTSGLLCEFCPLLLLKSVRLIGKRLLTIKNTITRTHMNMLSYTLAIASLTNCSLNSFGPSNKFSSQIALYVAHLSFHLFLQVFFVPAEEKLHVMLGLMYIASFL